MSLPDFEPIFNTPHEESRPKIVGAGCKTALPLAIPPLVDLHIGGGSAFVWLRLVGGYGSDLEFEEFGNLTIGVISEWYNRERSESDWESFLGVEWHWCRVDEKREYRDSCTRWAIEQGIAPGQPFLVEMAEPYYSKTVTMEGTEYDVEYDCQVVRVLPKSQTKAAASWDRFFKQRDTYLKAKWAEDDRLRHKAENDLSAMYIQAGFYFAPGQSSYDDIEMPAGLYMRLYSNHGHGLQLGEGRDDNGSHDAAFANLVSTVVQRHPHITEESLKKVHTKRSLFW